MNLIKTLHQLLEKEFNRQGSNGLVIWYDAGATLQPILEGSLTEDIRLLQHEGSYLALRFRLENQDPYFEGRWLVYIPEASEEESWLRDWELIGCCWEMDLLEMLHRQAGLAITLQARSLLRNVPQNARALAQRWPDLMATRSVTLESLTEALLAMALGLSAWQTEQAVFELLRSSEVKGRLASQGLWEAFCQRLWDFGAWEGSAPTREDVLRRRFQAAILLSELVSSNPDLSERFSAVLPSENRQTAFAGMARLWREREDLRSIYLRTAQKIEKEYELSSLLTPEEELLGVETFSGIDELWRRVAIESIAPDGSNYAEKAGQVRKIAQQRSHYFWARQDKASYWEPIEYAARLYENCKEATNQVSKLSRAEEFIHAYTDEGGWWQLDYYALASAAQAGSLREAERVRLLYPAWRMYGEYLDRANRIFAEAITNVGWQPDQPTFWSQSVTGQARTAVFMVDALRFDLAQQLLISAKSDGYQTSVKPIRGSLPSITEVGMSALLPGAESGLEIGVANARLRVNLEGQEITAREQRLAWLEQKMPPNSKAIRLDQIEQETYEGVRLLVVLSREVDKFGTFAAEIDPAGLLELTERIQKGIQILIEHGFERIFVVTDHGFLYLPPEVVPEGAGHPAAKICKRRFAIGANPPNCVVKPSSEIGLRGQEVFAFPSGLATFQIQGKTGVFLHGGISLQECVLPALEIKPAVTYEKVGAVMEVPAPVTSRILLIPVRATNITLFSGPRKVVVEIGEYASPVIELGPQQQSGVARVEWLGFADEPPAQIKVRLKDAESLQILDDKTLEVEIFL